MRSSWRTATVSVTTCAGPSTPPARSSPTWWGRRGAGSAQATSSATRRAPSGTRDLPDSVEQARLRRAVGRVDAVEEAADRLTGVDPLDRGPEEAGDGADLQLGPVVRRRDG